MAITVGIHGDFMLLSWELRSNVNPIQVLLPFRSLQHAMAAALAATVNSEALKGRQGPKKEKTYQKDLSNKCVCTHAYIYIYIPTLMYIYIYTCIYINMYKYVYIYIS